MMASTGQQSLSFGRVATPPDVLISLHEEWYDLIVRGEKKFEFRRRFLRIPVTAYIYVSGGVRGICARASFGAPIIGPVERIAEIGESQRRGGGDALRRYLGNRSEGFAIPILSHTRIEHTSLEDLRRHFPGFVVPQSYILLANKPDLLTFLRSRREIRSEPS